jgi:glycosyltransferase involved in cell wall biosynthesis
VALLAARLGPGYHPVILTGEVGPLEGDMTYYAQELGVKPLVLPGLGRELRLFTDHRLVWSLYRIFRAEKPAVVHTHTAKAGALGRLAAWFAGVPVIVHTFHGNVLRGYFGGLKSRLFLWVERLLAHVTDQIVTLGELQRKEILDMGVGTPDRVAVVPLGMELDAFMALPRRPGTLRSRLGLEASCRLVGIVARLVPIKGHRMFLSAARRVALSCPGVHFVVVGDGELRSELESAVVELGLSGRVHFTGWIRDLKSVYPDLDCLALASANEGLPTAILEAQASAVPVVATRVGSVPDLVEDGRSGWLVAPGDAEALAAAIERVLADPERAARMASEARERVGRYSIGRLLDDVDRLYGRLLEAKEGES